MDRLEAFALIAAQAAQGDLVFPGSVQAAVRLNEALNDPDCHQDAAVKLVLSDPLLAARTVGLANSSAYARHIDQPIVNARTAVMRLGYTALQALAAGMLVHQIANSIKDPSLRDKAQALRQHTAEVSALAQVLARRVTYTNPDTAMFAGTVHEIGNFYLLSRAEEFPGLLEIDPQLRIELGEDMIRHAVMEKLRVPIAIRAATDELRDAWLNMPPSNLTDTLVLAKQFASSRSPLAQRLVRTPDYVDSVLELVISDAELREIQAEAAQTLREALSA